ncbi:DarT ssDNA thymidine ADP-ribosyltransferase family protein [Bradyrhizobium sp. 8-10B]|uniref:DarT ssDNA thymidine ADP-ribosyltransferase family protein n=1 Tax=Bradyrhizobium sp. 8-10B TaxID=3344579 RepID=UPI0035BF0BC1
MGQWIINRGRLTESKNIGSLGHGVSLSSRGSGRLVTRLDTPPSSHRHHPDSAIAQALVHKKLPLSALFGIACFNDTVKAEVEQLCNSKGHKLQIVTRREWFL